MNQTTMRLNADKLILQALSEDITSEDVSANAVFKGGARGACELIAKADGVIAGLGVFARTFELLGEGVSVELVAKDGDEVERGAVLARVSGDIRMILAGERTALNYLQRMSGIATFTREMVKLMAGSRTVLLDTRKTAPNNRIFEKYAVKVGGGQNHRYNLSDGVLLKDNHISAAGGVGKAIVAARAYAPFVRKIEVEVETLEMAREAVEAGADIIMLDNMDAPTIKSALALIAGRAQTEISGNVGKHNVKELASLGADFISCGSLTHSAGILDLSLKNLKLIEE